eukprot:m.91015 g.91015  ORF g.91015 m.91015 type:complete len:195 (-) comp14610_c0_seq8:1200-1784(-)
MDFRCHHPIILTKLGVFDSNSDGLEKPITVKVWDVVRQQVIVRRTLSGSDGLLRGGARYIDVEGIMLPKDIRLSITAEGYGPGEQMYDNTSNKQGRIRDGGGIIEWLPGNRRTNQLGSFPAVEDTLSESTFPFMAGTFAFRAERIAPGTIFSLPWRVQRFCDHNRGALVAPSFCCSPFFPLPLCSSLSLSSIYF